MKSLVFIVTLLFCHIVLAMDGMIVRSKGTILLDGRPILPNQVVKVGQVVEAVGTKSYCQIYFQGGTTFLVKSGKVKIVESSTNASIISLIYGTIFNAVQKKSSQSFRIITNKASLAVRGTKFYVENTSDQLYLCVCEGEVELVEGDKNTIAVKRGEDIWYKKGVTAQVTPVKSDMWKMAKEGFSLMGIDIGNLNP